MRKYLLLAALFFSCTTGTPSPVNWPGVVQCVTPIASDVIAQVEGLLLSDGTGTLSQGVIAELEQLAQAHGADTVACLVNQAIQDWTKSTAAANEVRQAAAVRGQAFLALKKVTVQQ
jgi:hypothetical protein